MTQKHNKHIAPGLTAIAAVLALHATPVAAQEAVPPTTTTDTAPAPTPDPAPAAGDPLAPETQAEVTSTPESTAPAATRSTRTSRAAARPATRASAPRPARATPAPAASAPAPVAEPAVPIAADPAAMMPPPPPVAEPVPAPTPEPVASDNLEDILPIAGAAGAGVLALAGLGLAMRNRRRRREEEDEWAYDETVASEPVAVDPEPAMAREPVPAAAVAPAAAAAMATPRHDGTVRARPSGDNVSAFVWGNQSFAKRPEPKADPIPVKQPTTSLPEGFDVSRFGRHVQAAYVGPTPANPSLSLKNRLRRASFYDKVERDTGKPHPDVARTLEPQH